MKRNASPAGFGKASPFVAALVMTFCAVLLCGTTACSSEEGTTPECTQDVDGDGHNDVDKGCNPFAVCVVNGKVSAATECCKDRMGYELEACLYGYGAGPEPSGAASSGGGS